MYSASEKATKASYVVSQIIAKRMKPFSDAEYIKESLMAGSGGCLFKEKGCV